MDSIDFSHHQNLFESIAEARKSGSKLSKKQKHLKANMKLKYPLKFRCRKKARRYPMTSVYAICKSESDLHRHHYDYSKPQLFTTLCRQCHQIIHLYLEVKK